MAAASDAADAPSGALAPPAEVPSARTPAPNGLLVRPDPASGAPGTGDAAQLAALAAQLRAGGFAVEEIIVAVPATPALPDVPHLSDLPATPGATTAGPADAPEADVALIGTSPPIQDLLRTLRRVAPVRTTVLICGESGAGKELVARSLHRLSPRREGPWVAVNCGAIPANLLESELFGHRRGAFTDAVRDRRGLFEEASGGTLFLDEIGELPLELQPKLLRVLQEQELRPLGASCDVKVDTRVLAATVRDLRAEVAAGRFREDLYYRLNVIQIRVPPLRERIADLPLLVADLLARVNRRLGTRVRGTTTAVQTLLTAYPWPGNIRELENCIESAVVLAEGPVIEVRDLPDRIRLSQLAHLSMPGRPAIPDAASGAESAEEAGDAEPVPAGLSIKRATRVLEENLIRRALQRTGGNRTSAARLLEISHRTLLYKIKEFDIARDAHSAAPEE